MRYFIIHYDCCFKHAVFCRVYVHYELIMSSLFVPVCSFLDVFSDLHEKIVLRPR